MRKESSHIYRVGMGVMSAALLMSLGLMLPVSTVQAKSHTAGKTAKKPVVETAQKPEAIDMDIYTTGFATDYTKPQLQPIAGWFTRTFSDGRTIKLYVPEDEPLRARFLVIAVPEGVDAWDYLSSNGWIEKADDHKTCLYILEAGEGGWGTAEEEADYMTEAMNGVIGGKNGNNVTMFTTHGTFSVVGYEGGCAPLESWVMENPLYVYAQAYVDGEGAGASYQEEAETYIYDEKFPGSRQLTADQFDYAMANMGLTREDAITKADIPIPTWFVSYDEKDSSIEYWKDANDCLARPDRDGVYHQDINSEAWRTIACNENLKNWQPFSNYGFSEVHVTKKASVSQLFDFTNKYTAYTTVCAYSNNIAYNTDYTQALSAALEDYHTGIKRSFTYTNADGETASADLYALESTRVSYDRCSVQGTMYCGSIATADYDGDGVNDPREIILYVPDSARSYGKDGAPIVLVHPGMTQSAETFVACSGWIPVANDEGCVTLFIGEPYVTSTLLGYTSAAQGFWGDDTESINFTRGLVSFLKNEVDTKYVNLDFTRLYMSGHSAGSSTSQRLALRTESSYVAALGTTSLITRATELSDGYMPTYFIHGQVDGSDANTDLSVAPWNSTPNVANSPILYNLLTSVMKKNQLNVTLAADDEEAFWNSCTSIQTAGTRFTTLSWANDQGIELLKLGRTLLREHNCLPQEARLLYNYMKQFSVTDNGDGTQTRYYSASGFANRKDIVEIGASGSNHSNTQKTNARNHKKHSCR